MRSPRAFGEEQPGFRWGPFTTRIPFYHTRPEWPELWQGIVVAGATGLALIPVLMNFFGLSLDAAIAFLFIQSILIASAAIIFGEPLAPGWITPALPLVLIFLEGSFASPLARLHAMTALAIDFALVVLVLGVTGLGQKLVDWLPGALKGGIILGAAIAAFKRVFIDDYDKFFGLQPKSTTVALAVCLLLTFSTPIRALAASRGWLAWLVRLGLLPGFVAAAVAGLLLGEIHAEVEWGGGIRIPPFGAMLGQVSPFSIGWPSLGDYIEGIPLALISYTILFSELVTGIEILKAAALSRPDEKIGIDVNRSHLSVAIRNALSAILCPFFSTQGCLWAGAHVIIIQRWERGRKEMDSLHGGIASYYVFGVPVLYLVVPFVTAMRPLLYVALSMALVLTGFVCAAVAMSIPKTQAERGVAMLTGMALSIFPPWIGLIVGIGATLTLVGLSPAPMPLSKPAPAED